MENEQEQQLLDDLLARYQEVEAKRQEALDILFDESAPPAERRNAYREVRRWGRQIRQMLREINRRMEEP